MKTSIMKVCLRKWSKISRGLSEAVKIKNLKALKIKTSKTQQELGGEARRKAISQVRELRLFWSGGHGNQSISDFHGSCRPLAEVRCDDHGSLGRLGHRTKDTNANRQSESTNLSAALK